MNQKQVTMQEEQDALTCEYCCQKEAEILREQATIACSADKKRDASKCLRIRNVTNLALALSAII